jgi:hypothetical protein
MDRVDLEAEEMFNPKATSNSSARPFRNRPQLPRAKLTSTSSSGSSSSGSRSEDAHSTFTDSLPVRRNVTQVLHEQPITSGTECAANSIDCSSTATPTHQPIQNVCESMKKQIVARAFHGWLAYCRHLQTVRTHLSALVQPTTGSAATAQSPNSDVTLTPLTLSGWRAAQDSNGRIAKSDELLQQVYTAGCEPEVRAQVWPFLLGHYSFDSSSAEREAQQRSDAQSYELLMGEWLAVEAIVKQRDKESVAACLAKLSSGSSASRDDRDPPIANEVFTDSDSDTEEVAGDQSETGDDHNEQDGDRSNKPQYKRRNRLERKSNATSETDVIAANQILVTNPSVDVGPIRLESTRKSTESETDDESNVNDLQSEAHLLPNIEEREGQLSAGNSACVSPASSNGGVYTVSTRSCFLVECGDLFAIIIKFRYNGN